MSAHDQMCPSLAVPADKWAEAALMCRCDLIARVRVDERDRHALVLAELREVIAADFLAAVLEPCCDHDCARPEEYDDDAPDDDAFICTQGHWHSPMVICSAPVGHGLTSDRRCPGGAL